MTEDRYREALPPLPRLPGLRRGPRGPCSVAGCTEPARNGYGQQRLCDTHRGRKRRHGDPTVRAGVRKRDLQPYIADVRRIVRRAGREKIETALRSVAADLKDATESALVEAEGRLFRGPQWQQVALRELARVLGDRDVEPVAVGMVVGALYLMRLRERHRWPNDRAFVFDVARQVRKLSTVSYGSYFDGMTTRKTYRDLRPDAVAVIGDVLRHAYQPFGGFLVRGAELLAQRQQATRQAFKEGLDQLSK